MMDRLGGMLLKNTIGGCMRAEAMLSKRRTKMETIQTMSWGGRVLRDEEVIRRKKRN